jgi:methylenetetrahydrofolate dehydrogenase (NADP+)/methenyltetrahydrofolate cyclohydrolase
MMIINGKKIAEEIIGELKHRQKPEKFLAGIVVGDDPASVSFQKIKQKTAERLGIDYRIYALPQDSTNDGLRTEIGKIGSHKTCGGVVVQLPLPDGINRHYVLNAIPREKDIDVLGERALGTFYADRNLVLPPAAATIEHILNETGFRFEGKTIAVIGSGLLVGKPAALWLINRKANQVFVLERGFDPSILNKADLIISGVGQPRLFKGSHLKPGAGVIDFGYGQTSENAASEGGKLAGDFDPDETDHLNFYTPTPGGTGPILVAKLLENFYLLNS